ncbi:hypothetical protein P5673_005689 [Acropora cervicornis]|uniref:Uncharacterized protein n=1 Tax=Acropora cervicornis TaxID=6130 RepID=A0AAD9VCU2_ACRCE|nr:hypothetical protein P5673_005689 [Acropora cervicornis]
MTICCNCEKVYALSSVHFIVLHDPPLKWLPSIPPLGVPGVLQGCCRSGILGVIKLFFDGRLTLFAVEFRNPVYDMAQFQDVIERHFLVLDQGFFIPLISLK